MNMNTIEITAKNYSILSAAIVNRIERVEQLIEIFNKDEDAVSKKAYEQELQDAKNLQIDLIKAFMTL